MIFRILAISLCITLLPLAGLCQKTALKVNIQVQLEYRENEELELWSWQGLVDLAQTPAERERGLMYRKSLAKNDGMLFVFPAASELRFWMRNTLVPLTAISFDRHCKVVAVRRLTPLSENIVSLGRGQFVLEIAQDLNLPEGRANTINAEESPIVGGQLRLQISTKQANTRLNLPPCTL